jgi:membrane associated rhomboid family serine protease
MGLYDRDYSQSEHKASFSNAPQMRMAFPQLTPVVKWLLIINVISYCVQIFGGDLLFNAWFSVYPVDLSAILQAWRLVTYQFLHGSAMHIIFNMLGLCFLGPTLERHWGSKRFLIFYLSCGAAGALFYTLLVAVGFLPAVPMIGASGAILGILAACAILFPHFIVFILIFPIPIRAAVVVFTAIYLVAVITRQANAGGEAAHLAGMAAGAVYVFSQSWRAGNKLRIQSSLWKRRIAAERELRIELDRILQKVHDQGIHSLTSKEKRMLRRATEAEQKRLYKK